MSSMQTPSTCTLGDRAVHRLGYGAMQLAGPGCSARRRIARRPWPCCAKRSNGVDHIDTSDFDGPHITNQLIREALAPYGKDLVIVTKIGARRTDTGGWLPAFSPEELTQAVHDNLRNLGLDVLEW
jgi:pyridoxine 4-dehydrogenase